jgi:hypothetical protein
MKLILFRIKLFFNRFKKRKEYDPPVFIYEEDKDSDV